MVQQQSNDSNTMHCMKEKYCIDDIDILQALKRRESLYALERLPLKKKLRRSSESDMRDSNSPRSAIVGEDLLDATATTSGNRKSISPFVTPSTSRLRENICQWMYKVVDHCEYDRKVTGLAIHYFDRYLQLKGALAPTHLEDDSALTTSLQLLALTALYVACKIEGCRGCCLKLFIKLSAGKFTDQDVKTMELELMSTLQWLLNPPLPQEFSDVFISQLSKNVQSHHFNRIIREVSNYIIEVVIHTDTFKFENASVLGCASILISLQGIKQSSLIVSEKVLRQTLFKQIGSHFEFSTVDRIMRIESEMITTLNDYLSKFNHGDLHQLFDPNGEIYDSFADPPALV